MAKKKNTPSKKKPPPKPRLKSVSPVVKSDVSEEVKKVDLQTSEVKRLSETITPQEGSVGANAPPPAAEAVVPEAEGGSEETSAKADTIPTVPQGSEAPAVSLTDQTVSGPTKPTWCELLRGPSAPLERKGTSFTLDSGELCVRIPNEVIRRNQQKWDSFIIAQFHGKLPSKGALHGILNGIWSTRNRDISVSKLGGKAFIVKIPDPRTRKRVISQGMWYIEGQSMFVAAWEPGFTPVMPELSQFPVWLDFHEVPPHFYSEEGFKYIAGLLGDPKFLHPNTASMTNLEVARVFTVIDPRKKLPEAVNVQFESGAIQRIKVSSPWLPPLCEHCEEVGHNIKKCPTAPITCTSCNSSGHDGNLCPRRKHEKVVDQAVLNLTDKEVSKDGPSVTESKKQKQIKGQNLRYVPKIPSGTLAVDRSPGVDLVVATGSKSQYVKIGGSKETKAKNSGAELSGKLRVDKWKKSVVMSSDSRDGSSDDNVDSVDQESESEESDSDHGLSSESDGFTPVVSKKLKRFEKLTTRKGKGSSTKPKA